MSTLDIPSYKPENNKTVGFIQESKTSIERLPTSKSSAHLWKLTELSNSGNSFNLGSRSKGQMKKRETFGNSFGSQGQLPTEYKTSQGFYITDNFSTPSNTQHQTIEGHSDARTTNNNNSCHNLATTNNNSWQFGTTNNHKWSQEQLYSSFYKMRQNNDIILIPEQFWKQEKPFVPFKQVWADHEQQNAELINGYYLKKRMQEQQHQQEDKSLARLSSVMSSNSSNLKKIINNGGSNNISSKPEEDNSPYLPLGFTQLPHKPVTKNYYHNHHHQQDASKEGELKKRIAISIGKHFSVFQDKKKFDSCDSSTQQLNKQQMSTQQDRQSTRNSITNMEVNRHAKSSQLIESNNKSSTVGLENRSRQFVSPKPTKQQHQSFHENNYSPQRLAKYHQQPRYSMMNLRNSTSTSIPSQSQQELSIKDEIEIQLNQNKYSKEVYGQTLSYVESQAFSETYDKIQVSLDYADRIHKRTKVYNKRQSLETTEDNPPSNTLEPKHNGILAINEREVPVLTPSIMYCWVENDRDSWKPQPRIGTTIIYAGNSDFSRIYLVGGISSEMVKDVLVINPDDFTFDTLQHLEEQHNEEIDQQRENLLKRRQASQKKINKQIQKVQLANINIDGNNTLITPQKRVSQELPVQQPPSDFEDVASKYLFSNGNFSQRFNHTTVTIAKKSKFLIFGGEILNQEQQSFHPHPSAIVQSRQKFRPIRRNCLNDLISFDVLSREWRVHVGRGDVIEARRNHTATMVSSKHMIVIGGLNSEGHALFDVCVLDTTTFRWIIFNNFYNLYVNPFPAGIAFHAACFVAEEENSPAFNVLGTNSLSTVFKETKKNIDKNAPPQQFLKEEGLYVFGGIDEQGNYLKNKMMVLKQVANPPSWIELPTTGRGPEKRCMHTMNFMFNMSLCVIYGGKYESASSTKYYDDLFVLNLKNLAWIEVSQQGQRKPPRAMHCACVSHKQLIIFGGLNHNGFLKGNIEIIEFDQTLVMKMKRVMNYTLTLYQQIKYKRLTQIEEQALLQNQQQKIVEELEDNNNNNDTMQAQKPIGSVTSLKQIPPVIQKLKARVNLIDPERERELKENVDFQSETNNNRLDSTEKWKAPFKPNKQTSQYNTAAMFLAKTFLPMPAHCGKRPDA